ncbi:MAG: hypothetical protein JXB60_08435 [Candidatus Cloacimonetes bacterium]|nr:hypothetical protein [Candidatus Cloacimonadota bacterium]
MKLEIIDIKILNDGTKRYTAEFAEKELVILGFILESMEGWCNYTTVKNHEILLQIDAAPDFHTEVDGLIGYLQKTTI